MKRPLRGGKFDERQDAYFGKHAVFAPSSVTAVGRDAFPPWGKAGRSRTPPLRRETAPLPFIAAGWVRRSGADRVVRPYEGIVAVCHATNIGGDCYLGTAGRGRPALRRVRFSGRGWLSPPHPSAAEGVGPYGFPARLPLSS